MESYDLLGFLRKQYRRDKRSLLEARVIRFQSATENRTYPSNRLRYALVFGVELDSNASGDAYVDFLFNNGGFARFELIECTAFTASGIRTVQQLILTAKDVGDLVTNSFTVLTDNANVSIVEVIVIEEVLH